MDAGRTARWLWAVRLFKTRSLAARACESGRVKRRGQPLKPSSPVRPGDVLEVPFPEGPGTRTVAVLKAIDRRVGAPRAAACCHDHTPPEVLAQRRTHLENRRHRREGDQGRPTKKDRRKLDQGGGFFH